MKMSYEIVYREFNDSYFVTVCMIDEGKIRSDFVRG